MKSGYFRGKKVLVTGGAGLIGTAFVDELLGAGASVRTVRRRRAIPRASEIEVIEGDLRDPALARRACQGVEVVVHAAGVSGGSKQVQVDPVPMFTDSLLMNTVVLEAARQSEVQRLLFISNSSVYPRHDGILGEAMGEEGPPENETGMVKRVGETQARLYAKIGPLKVAIIRTGNAYGPWDNFDLEASHVIPALIRKAVERPRPYPLWGDGQAVRDFIHTRDIARGGLFLLEHHATAEPVNVATGECVSIRQALEIILRLTGYADAEIATDAKAPPAPAAKRLDLSRMHALGFAPGLSLEEGLRQTIDWYRARRARS
jgi:GDP-L-fucose synthase